MAASGSAPRRYAEALLGLAEDDRTVEAFRASLTHVASAFDRATVAALRDRAVPFTRRERALAAATAKEAAPVRSLLRVLLERDRIALVPRVARAFSDLVDERAGIAKARVTTAIALDEADREGVIRRLEHAGATKVKATFAVDPALIGGARVQLGDRLFDASLSAKLAALGRQLAS